MPDVVVNWSPMPSATDSVDGPILSAEIRCEDDAGNVVMSGDRFRAGTTTVTCKANDTSLNEGSAQFTIIVIGESFLTFLAPCGSTVTHNIIPRSTARPYSP